MPGRTGPVLTSLSGLSTPQVRRALDLPHPRPVIALFGTTSKVLPEEAVALGPAFRGILAAAIDAHAVFVTGGTNAGVISLLGGLVHGRVPMVGVLPKGRLGDSSATGPLVEPHHDHIVLAAGENWGDERPELERVVDAIASGCPVVGVLVGGGRLSAREVDGQLTRGRPVVVVAGSGRLADTMANAKYPRPGAQFLDYQDGTEAFRAVILGLLKGDRRAPHRRPPAASAGLPGIRRPEVDPFPLMGLDAPERYPEIASEIRIAESTIRDAFREADLAALTEQRRHRLLQVGTLVVGSAATTAAAVQAVLTESAWPAVLVSTLSAAATALSTADRRGGYLDSHLDERLAAERLRSKFFLFLAQEPPAEVDQQQRLARRLESEVARLRCREGP